MMNGPSTLKGYVPDIDATVVTRILDAGGTIVGKAHCEYFCRLLLDEPSMGSSPILVDAIFRIIEDVNRQGATTLLVEQNARMALRVAHRGYVIETGRIMLHDAAEELLRSDLVRKTHFGEKTR